MLVKYIVQVAEKYSCNAPNSQEHTSHTVNFTVNRLQLIPSLDLTYVSKVKDSPIENALSSFYS